MSQRALLESLPEGQRKHLDPASPLPMRMMAAKGLAPLPPKEMVVVLVGLSLDSDAKLAEAARTTLAGLPNKLLVPALEGALPAEALMGVAQVLAQSQEPRDEPLQCLVLNRQTPDEAIALVAPVVSAEVAEIIAANQERCLRSRQVVEGVRNNPRLLKSSKDRLFDFLIRSGVFYDGMVEVAEAMARLSPAEVKAAVANVELPQELDSLLADHEEDDERAAQVVEVLDSTTAPDEERTKRVPVLKLINGMSVAQKIALATKGNKEARSILVRDSNKLVAAAAIRNPRVTEPEIVAAAKSRSVSDEVVRIISRNKDMTRSYGVKKALVYNPKTPLTTAMHFLPLLRAADLRDVAKSKNVPTAVANQAKRLVQRKR